MKAFEESRIKEKVKTPEINKVIAKPDKDTMKYESPKASSLIDKPLTPVKSSPWGTTPVSNSPSTSHTLFDIINEEMTKLTVTKPKQEIKPQQIIVSSPPKGWNFSSIEQTVTKTPPKTISQIMAMEEQYLKQYQKYTNRNMDSIQLEEKAIEDLKRLYAVDNTSDMRITIELIQDTDLNVLSTCAPKWKK